MLFISSFPHYPISFRGAIMVILGIDPGTATTGFGIVEKKGNDITYVTCGVIETLGEELTPTTKTGAPFKIICRARTVVPRAGP